MAHTAPHGECRAILLRRGFRRRQGFGGQDGGQDVQVLPMLPISISNSNLSALVLAVSITYTYRIILCVEIVEHEIILHNIGSHDEVYD